MPSPFLGVPEPGHYQQAVTVMDFRVNLAAVRTRIDAAAERAGRRGADVRLLPVSKTVPEGRILSLIHI